MPPPPAFGAGLSRTVYQSYLPAFFIAGALCVFASLIVLTLSRQPKPKPQAAPFPRQPSSIKMGHVSSRRSDAVPPERRHRRVI